MGSHHILNLSTVCLFERAKTPKIEWLEDMRGMGRHTERDDIVELTIFLKLIRMVTLMTIEDQEAITTYSSKPSMLFKMLNSVCLSHCCPTIISDRNYSTGRKSAILIPRCKVIFPRNNDKRRHRPVLVIDVLDCCYPFPVARLYLFCLCTPV